MVVIQATLIKQVTHIFMQNCERYKDSWFEAKIQTVSIFIVKLETYIILSVHIKVEDAKGHVIGDLEDFRSVTLEM